MFRTTLLSAFSLVACQDEQSSLLQTASRDSALTRRAHNFVDAEDEEVLEDAIEGKQCTNWLADEAVAKSNDVIEDYRQKLKELGFEERINKHIKIAAYCPAMIADSALTFLGTPCEDRDKALTECFKGLEQTCKYERKAIKKMIENAKKLVKKEYELAKKVVEKLPREFRPVLPKIEFGDNFDLLKKAAEQKNCDAYKKLKLDELTRDVFTDLSGMFDSGIAEIHTLQEQQIGAFTDILAQGQLAVNVAQASPGDVVAVNNDQINALAGVNENVEDAVQQAANELGEAVNNPDELQDLINQEVAEGHDWGQDLLDAQPAGVQIQIGR